jgi:cytochrome b involved in lipid metabolism
MDLAGGDCTEEFDDIGHSEEAEAILKTMYVGDVKVRLLK